MMQANATEETAQQALGSEFRTMDIFLFVENLLWAETRQGHTELGLVAIARLSGHVPATIGLRCYNQMEIKTEC